MRARSREIELVGVAVTTPLLVPGFSSKAMAPVYVGGRSKSDLQPASVVHTDAYMRAISHQALISAYDIHHGLIAATESIGDDFAGTPYAIPELIIIDSGWYEKSLPAGGGIWANELPDAGEFTLEDYENVLKRLDPAIPAVIVSWDDDAGATYDVQRAAAQRFFDGFPDFASALLLKPERTRQYHDFRALSESVARNMRIFDVIGVTEKDLGQTIVDRMCAIARLRSRLDEAGVQAPIHVFGGLDPLYTPLYFLAGAETFDGLSWLRYAFRDGMAIYREAEPLLLGHFGAQLYGVALEQLPLQNLNVLDNLRNELMAFHLHGGNFDKLLRGALYEKACDAMESQLGGRRGR